MKKLQLELKKQFDLDFSTSTCVKISANKTILYSPETKYLVLESTEDKIKSYNKVVSYLSDKGFVKQEIIKSKSGNEYIQFENEFITVYKLTAEDFPGVIDMSIDNFESVVRLISNIHSNSIPLANLVFNNSDYSIDSSFVEFFRRIEATKFTLNSSKVLERLKNKYKFTIKDHTFELLAAHAINIETLTEDGQKVLNTFIEKQNMINCEGQFALVLSEECTIGSPIFDYAKVVVSAFAINSYKDIDSYISIAKNIYSKEHPTQTDSMYFDLVVDYFLLEALGKSLFSDSEDREIEKLLHTLCSRAIGCWE